MMAAFAVSVSAYAYDIVNLPETMSLADAMEIFDVSEISSATVSNLNDNMHITISQEQIEGFYNEAANIKLYRTINPTPFRGTAINLFTKDGSCKSYYLTAGVQIGMYGKYNYVCYAMSDKDLENFMYIDSLYRDEEYKQIGAEIYRNTDIDFLKIPEDLWAQSSIKEAASRTLLPYGLTSKYQNYISREEFCMLLGNLIAVAGGYASLDAYVSEKGITYLKNYFTDCEGRDDSINILYALNIVNGKDDDIFDPAGCITRQEAAKLLCETASKFVFIETKNPPKYNDENQIAPWADFYVDWVTENGIMNGVGEDYFDPEGLYTVQQAVSTVTRLFNIIGDE